MLAVVIPVKSFDLAKGRLAESLTPEQRATFAKEMATGVLNAAHQLPKWVVCGDKTVAAWALENSAGVIWNAPTGLNSAASAGLDWCASEGYARVLVAHGDLPLARDLTWLADQPEDVVVVTDRRNDGTNVMIVPTGVGFEFQYGPGSAAKHCAQAAALGLSHALVRDHELGWDVDLPEDLEGLEH